MNYSKIVQGATLALALGATAFGAQAAEDNGFYLGAGAGQALVDDGPYDDEDTAFSAFAGYQFNRHFALEGGYADFGEIEPGIAGTSLEAGAAYITAIGIVPFTDRLEGYAKAGIGRWDLDTELPGLVGNNDDNGNDPTYGLGLQYRFNDLVALRGEYNRFEIEDSEVDLAQLQLRFDF